MAIHWAQVKVDAAEDDELLELMHRCNFLGLVLGIESIDSNILRLYNKNQTIENIKDSIKKFHKHKLGTVGSFIFGSDEDSIEIIRRTTEFVKKIPIDFFFPWIQCPYPGTALYKELKGNGRLLTEEWKFYDATHVVFLPKNITPHELQKEYIKGYRNFYSLGRLIRKAFNKKYSFKLKVIIMGAWYFFNFSKWMRDLEKYVTKLKYNYENKKGLKMKMNYFCQLTFIERLKEFFILFYLFSIYSLKFKKEINNIIKRGIVTSRQEQKSLRLKKMFLAGACGGYLASKYINSEIKDFSFHLKHANFFAYWSNNIIAFDAAMDGNKLNKLESLNLLTRCMLAICTGKEKVDFSDLSPDLQLKYQEVFNKPLEIPKDSLFYPNSEIFRFENLAVILGLQLGKYVSQFYLLSSSGYR